MIAGTPGRCGDGSRDCGSFYLDFVGQFGPEQVHVHWSESRRHSNEQVDRQIEHTWQEQLALAQAKGQRLYDGRLCRLVDCGVTDHALNLTLGQVSYKEFVGTNLTHPALRYAHGPEVLADPAGVSAAVVTGDNYVLLAKRSQQVYVHPGRWHPIGGIMEPGNEPGAVPCPFRALRKEMEEELGLPGESILHSVCLGVVRDKATVQPELIFDVRVGQHAESIVASQAAAQDAGECENLVSVRDHPGAVVTFLEKHYAELTPVALATLLLHGQRHWGTGWFAAARGYLQDVV
jgi:8-oxo-dGTP pyrophosphatase MutT (NUDIX family)